VHATDNACNAVLDILLKLGLSYTLDKVEKSVSLPETLRRGGAASKKLYFLHEVELVVIVTGVLLHGLHRVLSGIGRVEWGIEGDHTQHAFRMVGRHSPNYSSAPAASSVKRKRR